VFALVFHFKVKIHFKLLPVYLSFPENAKMENMSAWYDNIVSKEVVLNQNKYFIKPWHWVFSLSFIILAIDAASHITYTVVSKSQPGSKYLE
jgi:hypothetical protein